MTNKAQNGFTLIEVVIYLALFAILFSGAVVAAYSVLETSGKNHTRAMMQEEGEFMLAKINWAVSNAKTITTSPDGQTLTADDLKFSKLAGRSELTLSISGGAPEPLNNDATEIEGLFFTHLYNPEGASVVFALSGNNPGGTTMVATFSTSAYLRK